MTKTPPCKSSWRLLKKMDSTRELDLRDDEPPGGHGYGVSTISLFLRLVLEAGVSLRGVPRVLAVIAEAFGLPLEIPNWTTGRLWLLRLGLGLLSLPLKKADDWAWLTDHSVQIGPEKCLVILGIRLRDLPLAGKCLQHQHMHLIALVPSRSWTGQDVDVAFEQATKRTGVPRVIIDDHGSDLHGGVKLFQERHADTAEIYDAKHKAACLLKHRLEKEPRWQEFQTHLGQTRCAIQQTELAFLVPPASKPKARFMNLEPQLAWAEGVLKVLHHPPAAVQQWASPERVQEKLGWLQEFADPVAEWFEWQQVVNLTVEFVGRQGVCRGAAKALGKDLPRKYTHSSSAELAAELTAFVATQEKQTKRGERFPGSTEVLESCFGKMKQLEKQQARGGFTSLVVSFGALLAEATTEIVNATMEHSRTKDVYEWCKEHLGTTLFGKRKIAFAEGATKIR
jgi:hypothetical protein